MIFQRARRFAAALAVFSIALAPACAFAAEDQAEEQGQVEQVAAIVFDLAILRPAGFVRCFFGVALAPLVYVLTLGHDQRDEILRQLVGDPVEYTFERELGDF